jgi:hypothetical protein
MEDVDGIQWFFVFKMVYMRVQNWLGGKLFGRWTVDWAGPSGRMTVRVDKATFKAAKTRCRFDHKIRKRSEMVRKWVVVDNPS